jgi:hypothetical protein
VYAAVKASATAAIGAGCRRTIAELVMTLDIAPGAGRRGTGSDRCGWAARRGGS